MNSFLATTMNHRHATLTGLVVCLVLVFTLNSCDNTVGSIGNNAAYSIYGIFELKADTNYIRIKNLTVPLVRNSKHSLNATVHLKNLKTGRSQLLTQDSLVNFYGVLIHNLETTMPIRPMTTYKVIIKRKSDGQKTTKKVTAPLPTKITIRPRVSSCGTKRTIAFKKIIAGETLVAYVVAARKIPPPDPRDPLGNKPQKKYFVKKIFRHFARSGKFGNRSFKFTVTVQFPCQLKSPKIYMYSAIYGPGYDKNKPLPPDSVRHIDRFLKSKLIAVVKDTLTFLAY